LSTQVSLASAYEPDSARQQMTQPQNVTHTGPHSTCHPSVTGHLHKVCVSDVVVHYQICDTAKQLKVWRKFPANITK